MKTRAHLAKCFIKMLSKCTVAANGFHLASMVILIAWTDVSSLQFLNSEANTHTYAKVVFFFVLFQNEVFFLYIWKVSQVYK